MRNYKTEKQLVKDLPKFYLGQEVETPSGDVGVITQMSMPSNGLYLSPERAEVVVWFSDKGARVLDTSGRWGSYTFRFDDLKEVK